MGGRVGVTERSVVVAGVSAGALRASGRVVRRERIREGRECHIVVVLKARFHGQGDLGFGFG